MAIGQYGRVSLVRHGLHHGLTQARVGQLATARRGAPTVVVAARYHRNRLPSNFVHIEARGVARRAAPS